MNNKRMMQVAALVCLVGVSAPVRCDDNKSGGLVSGLIGQVAEKVLGKTDSVKIADKTAQDFVDRTKNVLKSGADFVLGDLQKALWGKNKKGQQGGRASILSLAAGAALGTGTTWYLNRARKLDMFRSGLIGLFAFALPIVLEYVLGECEGAASPARRGRK